MAGRITAALQGLVDVLTDAGVPAALEPGQVRVPGAWVVGVQVDQLTLAGLDGANLVANVYLVAPDNGTVAALDELSGMLDLVLSVVVPATADGDVIATNQAISLPHTSSPLPAFRVPVDLTID